MALHLHRAIRADVLADGLAEVLLAVPADPFAPDLVAVPTRGVERFLAQRLALRLGASPDGTDGICANVLFTDAAEVFARALAGSEPASADSAMNRDEWSAANLRWHVLAAMRRLRTDPALSALDHYLSPPGGPRGRDLATASRLGHLLAAYDRERPEITARWTRGDTEGLPTGFEWQLRLWQAVVSGAGLPSGPQLANRLRTLAELPGEVDLPARLSLFGPGRLASSHLQVLEVLGSVREVHIWLVDPSPGLWQELGGTMGGTVGGTDARRGTTLARSADTSDRAARHPLLRSLGRDFRELAMRLAPLASTDSLSDPPTGPRQGTLLWALQSEIAGNLRPRAAFPLLNSDKSVQVHACHGQDRQVEVVREVILDLLERDLTLEPRDIMVMCPDLDTYAPLFSAAFAPSGPSASPQSQQGLDGLRLRIADRTPEQANEQLAAIASLLALADSRVTMGSVLDFAALPAVARRFGFSREDLERFGELVELAGVRWGWDERTRERFGIRALAQGTWAAGLDRLLVGVTLSEAELATLATVAPVDDVGSSDVELLGRISVLIAALGELCRHMVDSHPLAFWVDLLRRALDELTRATPDGAWMTQHAATVIAAPLSQAGPLAADLALDLHDIRWLLRGALAGRPTRANFRSGGLTVASLVPMRSVPHRVICLVGMDEGTFPRSAIPDGDDLLAREPRIGERDARSEERQLLLEAIMAATDTLVITYCGADDRTNEARPPCVPVGELLDALAATAHLPKSAHGSVREQVLVHHPLQPFDARNFSPGVLGSEGVFSHDAAALAAARAASGLRSEPAAFLPGDLPPGPMLPEVSLNELGRFLPNPVSGFLTGRLGLPSGARDDPAEEDLPIELDSLQRWQVGSRILEELERGMDPNTVDNYVLRSGALPPGALGVHVLSELRNSAANVAATAAALRTGPAESVRVALTLPSGRTVSGMVTQSFESEEGTVRTLLRTTFSRTKPRAQLRLWLDLLACSASTSPHSAPALGASPSKGAQLRWAGILVGPEGLYRLFGPPRQQSLELLDQLVDLRERGLRAALPLPAAAGREYATRRLAGLSAPRALAAAEQVWAGKYGEAHLPEMELVWGEGAPFNALTAEVPRPDEPWSGSEPTRFGALSMRLWQPLLACQGGVDG